MNIQTIPDKAEIESALGLDRRGRRHAWMWRVSGVALAVGLALRVAFWAAWRQERTAAVSYQPAEAPRPTLVVEVQATGELEPASQVAGSN